ncbi:MAG TPA: tyrosine-type recombinase/integrase [Kofleriaceae bacterium]|nr:tyrosine-type recombinase/integrase [Kofleriaceae bacterium]
MKPTTKKRKQKTYTARITVAEYAWRWLARKVPNLKPSTRYRYIDALRQICEGLGDGRMADLTPGDVSDWFASLPRHLSAATCNGYLRVLRVMTRDAKADLRLVHWACDRVMIRPPDRYTDEEPNALSASELGRMLVAMKEHEPAWYPLFSTMAMTGMRFGEASALQWKDIDFEVGKISVRRNQVRGMIGTPKTLGSTRTIPLVPELAAILQEHSRRVKAGAPEMEWVFPSASGKPHPSGVLRKPIQRVAAIIGLRKRITPHGLRRTLNTLALEVAPAETIRLIMGHVTSDMTTRYNAPSLDSRRDVLARVTAKIETPSRTAPPERTV